MQNSTHSESLCKLTKLIPSVMKILTENLFLYDLCRTWLCACVKAAETQTTLFTSVIWSRRIFNRALLKLPAVILIVMNCISNWKRSKVVTHLEKTGRQNSGLCERCIKFKHLTVIGKPVSAQVCKWRPSASLLSQLRTQWRTVLYCFSLVPHDTDL